MHIGVVGVNHKQANLSLREMLAKACHKQFSYKNFFQKEFHFILLSTCNRTEIYFYAKDLPKAHAYILDLLRLEMQKEFDQKLYSYFGQDCFFHLGRVTSGLDSAIVAETAVKSQVNHCYEGAKENGILPKELHYLFQKCLKIGKEVRSTFFSEECFPNLEHAIYGIGKSHFKKGDDPKILLVGASAINYRIAELLLSRSMKNISVCSRTYSNSKSFGEKLSIAYLPWEKKNCWFQYDWVICATKSPDYLLHKGQLEEKSNSFCSLITDLSVPRNVDPLLGENSCIYNIDQINSLLSQRRMQLDNTLIEADLFVSQQAAKYCQLFHRREQQQKVHSLAFCA